MQIEIKPEGLPRLQKYVDRLAKRASKIGVPALTVTDLGRKYVEVEPKTKPATYVEVAVIDVVGTPPKIEGWEFIARIEHEPTLGNILQVAPGQVCPPKYRKADLYNCDHCHKHIFRKDTFILREEKSGKYKQIGRQCIRDFIGYKNPMDLVWFFNMGDALRDFASGIKNGPYFAPLYRVSSVMPQIVAAIRVRGYVSRKMVETYPDKYFNTTANDVQSTYHQQPRGGWEPWQLEIMNPTIKDVAEAEQVIAWVKSWDDKKVEGNEFNFNVRKFVNADYIRLRDFGYIACLPFLRKRELDMLEAKVSKKNEHVGNPGEKLEVQLTVKNIASFPGFTYGSTCYAITFEDADGRKFKWLCGDTKDMAVGETWELFGTIKKHEVWKDWKFTVLTRCKVVRRLDK